MFLDDELYQIGSKVKADYSNHIEIIKEMVWCCMDRSSADLKHCNDSQLLPYFKRVNTSWNIAVDKLKKENKDFVKKNGFITFLYFNEEFNILRPVLEKLNIEFKNNL